VNTQSTEAPSPRVNRTLSLNAQIAQVERRLEMRRQRAVRLVEDGRRDVERALSWLPLFGVAGALAIGVAVGRRPRASLDAVHATVSAPVARVGLMASVAGLGATALRIAMSPQARALWSAYRGRQARRMP